MQIVPLDSLWLSAKLGKLQNIQKVGISFEHEAERHMRFSKFEKLIRLVDLNKQNFTIYK